jgi:hypothetical protein
LTESRPRGDVRRRAWIPSDGEEQVTLTLITLISLITLNNPNKPHNPDNLNIALTTPIMIDLTTEAKARVGEI